jgi:hypothetical protein
MDGEAGLAQALDDGDAVILSTGATATVRGSYPQGYRGDVRIVLNGAEELERADALVIAQWPPNEPDASDDAPEAPLDESNLTRAPSRRMQD